MSDPIKAGMYRGENKVKQVSLDRRVTKIKTEDGYVEVPSMEYVRDLEQQILALRKQLDIVDGANKHQHGLIKHVVGAVKKVDAKLR